MSFSNEQLIITKSRDQITWKKETIKLLSTGMIRNILIRHNGKQIQPGAMVNIKPGERVRMSVRKKKAARMAK